jgi:hypothetical protein
VQVDAQRVYVALARPIPVPDVRTTAPGVLGTSLTRRVPRAAVAARNASPWRLRDGNGLEEYPMFVANALTVLLLLTLVLAMAPKPPVAAPARS